MGLTLTQIHGGMKIGDRDSPGSRISAEREFKESAQVLVATEAAGEGINLQFCWLMINYDIPWNLVRLEQRPLGILREERLAARPSRSRPPERAPLRTPRLHRRLRQLGHRPARTNGAGWKACWLARRAGAVIDWVNKEVSYGECNSRCS